MTQLGGPLDKRTSLEHKFFVRTIQIPQFAEAAGSNMGVVGCPTMVVSAYTFV